jgi:toxin ParE1/3/4
VKRYSLLSDVASDADIEAAFEWYESEQPGLGLEFLEEVRAAYTRILEGPFKYQELRSGIRRALTRRFPYGIYFSVEDDLIVVIAVLDTARDPAEWQFRI